MQTKLYTELAALDELAAEWNDLADGEPMRSHNWLAAWWRHYGSSARGGLHVVAVVDEQQAPGKQLVGLAPWRIERSLRRGVTIRWLGDGEVCTDHSTILTKPGFEADVADALAYYLAEEQQEWQLLELTDVDQDDPNVTTLCDRLAECSAIVDRLPAGACWSFTLPEDWDALLQLQSKSHRKQIRRSERNIARNGSFAWHAVENRSDWETAWPILIDLHQRRRLSLGEPGCFASERWAAFHREASLQLLERGQLRLFWSELDGKPLTAEYLLAGPTAWRAYQGGLDPDRLDEAPGRLSLIHLLRDAIEAGVSSVDFMRGDEEYKPHWRAVAQPTEHVHVAPPRLSAQVRNQADRVARQVRGAAKAGLRALGLRS